jgi:PAS domain S-box-containing protein
MILEHAVTAPFPGASDASGSRRREPGPHHSSPSPSHPTAHTGPPAAAAGDSDDATRFALGQAIPLMVFVSDLDAGRYRFINRRGLEWLGYAAATPVRQIEMLEHVHPEDRERAAAHLERTRELEDGGVLDFEVRSKHADGTFRHLLCRMSVLERDADGHVRLIISAAQDITERVTLEAQLRHAQKMEAVGQLAGGVAHDFNNLLTVILGYAETISSGLEADDPIRADAVQIVRAARRAATLTQQLLASARRQASQPVPLDLNTACRGIESMLRRLIPANIEFRLETESELRRVHGDPVEIEQVLMNLAVNARDAMPEGGTLVISTANVDVERGDAMHRQGVARGRYVVLGVEDSGVGMAPAVRSRIFEPFFSTKPADRGTGLGLSVVYGIVQQGGGQVLVHSEPGRGSRFEVLLPAVASVAASELNLAEDLLAAHGLETVLLVEDDAAVRRLAREGLEAYGYHVIEATDGEAALETAREFGRTIHVAVSDVVMPGMGGTAFAVHLAVLHPETRVLFVSGYSDDTSHEQDWAYLQKPFTPAALARAVRRTLTPAPASP